MKITMAKKAVTMAAQEPVSQGNTEDTEKLIELGRRYRAMEEDVCNLRYMAELSASRVEGEIGSSHKEITGREDFYYIQKHDVEATLFAVYHLQNMINAFTDRYFEKD